MRAGKGHLHTRASGPNNVTPWMAQRAALGDPWSGGMARASVTLRTRLPRGVAQTRMRGSWGCRRTVPLPRPPVFPTPASAAASAARTPLGQRLRQERRKNLSQQGGRHGGREPGDGWGWVGWRRHPNPALLRRPHSGSVWDQAWPVAPSLLALRPQSRSGVPRGPPGTGVNEGGRGGEKAPTLCPSASRSDHTAGTPAWTLAGRPRPHGSTVPAELTGQQDAATSGRAGSLLLQLPTPNPRGRHSHDLVCWTQGYTGGVTAGSPAPVLSLQPELESSRALKQIRTGEDQCGGHTRPLPWDAENACSSGSPSPQGERQDRRRGREKEKQRHREENPQFWLFPGTQGHSPSLKG